MAYTLLGQNFTPPDVEPKVTGRAKHAEDIRVEGMVFCRLLPSPIPHGRVTNIDASEALAMEGVVGVLTADEVPSHPMDPILSNEPMFVGQPILAVAAVDEATAMDAIERIQVDIEPLPFTLDPLQSLYPGGPNARSDGNSATRGIPIRTIHRLRHLSSAVSRQRLTTAICHTERIRVAHNNAKDIGKRNCGAPASRKAP